MRKLIRLVILMIGTCLIYGCGKEQSDLMLPEEEQIRQICELSTLECEFNNVAKGEKTKGEGIAHLGEKDRKYWVEYVGIVKLGIDMAKVSMEIKDTNVFITLPKAEIQAMDIKDGSYNEDSVITSQDAFFNKNKITVDEQQDAIADAQATMERTILESQDLMQKAQDRAKTLIENYIKNIGAASGITYNIQWKYID